MSNTRDWITDKHPVNALATALGVDRATLARALAAAGKKQATLADAVAVITKKSEDSANRSRKQAAEAEDAEIALAERKGELMLKSDHVRWCREYGTEVRANIMAMRGISEKEKKGLCADLEKIAVSE